MASNSSMDEMPYCASRLGLRLTSKVFTSPPKLTMSAMPGTERKRLSITQSCSVFNSLIFLWLLDRV